MGYTSETKDVILDTSIKEVILEAVDKINGTALPPHKVEVCISEDPRQVIPETGTGGWTENPSKVWIYFDSTNENFIKQPKERIMSAATHEFGHAFRELTVPFPGTLLDDVVAEGIADHLDLEIVGGDSKPWSHALNSDEIRIVYKKAEPLLDKRDHDHAAWFFGSKQQDIPEWAGYALGFDIVHRYLEKHSAYISDVIHLDSHEFLGTYNL